MLPRADFHVRRRADASRSVLADRDEKFHRPVRNGSALNAAIITSKRNVNLAAQREISSARSALLA